MSTELTGPALTVARILERSDWHNGRRELVAGIATEIVTALGLAACDRCDGTGTAHVRIYGYGVYDVDCGACRGTGIATIEEGQ
ncbi:hypothetical protein [Glycomyces tarimensis]